MAQPTDTPEQFEVSEPSTALPVPALSRYRRAERRGTTADTASAETSAEARSDAQPGPRAEAQADARAEAQAAAPAANPAATSAAAQAPTPAEDRPGARSANEARTDTRPRAATEPASPEMPPAEAKPPSKRPLDPIVQPASSEWATDPSPPQPVGPGPAEPGPSADRHTGSPPAPNQTPALRRGQHHGGAQNGRRKRPFWKRLAMPRSSSSDAPPVPPRVEIPRDLLKPAIERIDHLTRRFEREQKALQNRLDDFEHNLTRLWELEEQMGMEEMRAQLAVMRANQEEIADGLHILARRVTIGASAVVATLAALLIWLAL